MSLSNFLKHASTLGKVDFFPLEMGNNLSLTEAGKAALEVLLRDEAVLVLVQGSESRANLEILDYL